MERLSGGDAIKNNFKGVSIVVYWVELPHIKLASRMHTSDGILAQVLAAPLSIQLCGKAPGKAASF